jgi:diguanylate cyclase (GGDEF)-like protein/PAS domain S-box-containing protein
VMRVRAADGAYRVLETVGRNLGDDPDVRGLVLNSRDITDRCRAEEALRGEERRFRSLVAHASDFALVWDAKLRLTYVSPSVADVTGGQLVTGSQMNYQDRVHPDDVALVECQFRDLMAAPIAVSRRMQLRLRLGGDAGEYRWLEAVATNLLDDPDVAGIVINAHDVTDRHEQDQRLAYQANHDPLTGLPNRLAFEVVLSDRLAALPGADPIVLCFVDLDHFKDVNDSLGHDVGDQLLHITAQRIRQVVRADSFVARLGGDEFVVITEHIPLEHAEVLARRLLYAISQPIQIGGTQLHVTASIGMTVAAADRRQDRQTLMSEADTAMYAAKASGRDQVARFDATLRDAARCRLSLETSLHNALDHHEFTVHYQPLVHAKRRDVVGVEALVRWEQPNHGLVLPDTFLPDAERSGLISRIDEQVLHQVLSDLRAMPELPRVWINLSVRELARTRYTRRITTAAIEAAIGLDRLGFEVTETALAGDTTAVTENLTWLRDHGAHIALDDYGTGYASLANLKRLPIDELKIDKSLIDEILTQSVDWAIVRAITDVARALNLSVVAEGVESEAQAETLTQLGIDTLQGFRFSHPVPRHELRSLLQ